MLLVCCLIKHMDFTFCRLGGEEQEVHFSARAEMTVFTTVARSYVQICPIQQVLKLPTQLHVLQWSTIHDVSFHNLLCSLCIDNFIYESWQETAAVEDNGVSVLMALHHIQLLSCASHACNNE